MSKSYTFRANLSAYGRVEVEYICNTGFNFELVSVTDSKYNEILPVLSERSKDFLLTLAEADHEVIWNNYMRGE